MGPGAVVAVTKRARSLAAAACLAAAPSAALADGAAARSVDPLALGCAAFLELAPAERTRVATWLDGFVKATRNRPEEVGDTVIGHPLDPVVAGCEREPKLRLVDVWMKRYPGGASATPPFRVTCRELAGRDASVRGQVASFLEGFVAQPEVGAGATAAVSLASPGARLDAACARRPRAKAAEAFREAR